MKKNLIALMLSLVMMVSITGCGNNTQNGDDINSSSTPTSSTTSTTSETGGMYVDDDGNIIDSSTGETISDGSVTVDEDGNIIDTETGETVVSKEESDHKKEEIKNPSNSTSSSSSSSSSSKPTNPNGGNTTKPTNPPTNSNSDNSKPTEPPKDTTPPTTTPDDPKHTHKFEYYYTEVPAYCDSDGIDIEKCFDCGETREVTNKQRPAHNFIEGWYITKQPTLTETGIKERKCYDCGFKETTIAEKVSLKHKPTATEFEMLEFINASRKEAGVAPLAFNYMYYDCAYIRGQEIKQVYSHDRPNGKSFMTVLTDNGFSIPNRIGENIQRGENYGTEGAHIIFMNSPGHKANILWEEYTSVSIRVFIDESTNKYYVVENFFG